MHPIMLIIKWLGQACFVLTTTTGMNIMFDPYHNGIVYPPINSSAQVVFVSHNHADHNAVELVKGKPLVVPPFPTDVKDESATVGNDKFSFDYESVKSYHDNKQGKLRGFNSIHVVKVDGMNICHLGDLGTTLTTQQIKYINRGGRIDILMIPVGGVYTIDGKTAIKVVHQLNPKIVIPMHYKTPPLKINLNTADEFLKGFENVKHVDKLEISKASLPKETTVYVLKY